MSVSGFSSTKTQSDFPFFSFLNNLGIVLDAVCQQMVLFWEPKPSGNSQIFSRIECQLSGWWFLMRLAPLPIQSHIVWIFIWDLFLKITEYLKFLRKSSASQMLRNLLLSPNYTRISNQELLRHHRISVFMLHVMHHLTGNSSKDGEKPQSQFHWNLWIERGVANGWIVMDKSYSGEVYVWVCMIQMLFIASHLTLHSF